MNASIHEEHFMQGSKYITKHMTFTELATVHGLSCHISIKNHIQWPVKKQTNKTKQTDSVIADKIEHLYL